MAIFQVNLGYPVFIEAKDDGGGGGDNRITAKTKRTTEFCKNWLFFVQS